MRTQEAAFSVKGSNGFHVILPIEDVPGDHLPVFVVRHESKAREDGVVHGLLQATMATAHTSELEEYSNLR